MKVFFTILISLSMHFSYANEKKKEDVQIIDFNNIKEVLKNDMLGEEVVKKQKAVRVKKLINKAKEVSKYNIPPEEEFWSFLSEYWLVKNVTVLKWDFTKPDYGLEKSYKEFLEDMGIFEKKFRILILDTPEVAHFALPSNNDEIIYLLSAPFIRTLDLTKLEISILLFEDYLRLKNNFFKNFVSIPGVTSFIGGNFHGKKLDKKLIQSMMTKYDEIIFEKGFDFQQQFKVTSEMSKILKSNMKLWNSYYQMLKKVDNLVKTNLLYQKYLKIYPSPELQINWIKPESKSKF